MYLHMYLLLLLSPLRCCSNALIKVQPKKILRPFKIRLCALHTMIATRATRHPFKCWQRTNSQQGKLCPRYSFSYALKVEQIAKWQKFLFAGIVCGLCGVSIFLRVEIWNFEVGRLNAADACNSFTNTWMRCGDEVRRPQRDSAFRNTVSGHLAGLRVPSSIECRCALLIPMMLSKDRNRNAFPSRISTVDDSESRKFNSNKHLQSSVCGAQTDNGCRNKLHQILFIGQRAIFEMEYFLADGTRAARARRPSLSQCHCLHHATRWMCIGIGVERCEPWNHIIMSIWWRVRDYERPRKRLKLCAFEAMAAGVRCAVGNRPACIAHQLIHKRLGVHRLLALSFDSNLVWSFVRAQVSCIHHVCLFAVCMCALTAGRMCCTNQFGLFVHCVVPSLRSFPFFRF